MNNRIGLDGLSTIRRNNDYEDLSDSSDDDEDEDDNKGIDAFIDKKGS